MEACGKWWKRLSAWFDGEVSDLEADEVRSHLLHCAGCRATMQRWGDLRDDLDLLQPAGEGGLAPGPAVLERMAGRFEEGLAREVHALARSLRLWRVAAAVLLALGVALAAADRIVLPGSAMASPPRDIEREIEDLLQRPLEASPQGPNEERGARSAPSGPPAGGARRP